jgi:hypothetical protein
LRNLLSVDEMAAKSENGDGGVSQDRPLRNIFIPSFAHVSHFSGTWSPDTVRSMLQQGRHIGDWTWNKYRWSKNRKTGCRKRRLREQDLWVRKERFDLAIISTELWSQVQ